MSKRHQDIIQLVSEKGFVKISQLAQHFQVSQMSIRRDATWLADKKLVKRVHGGLLSPLLAAEGNGDFPARDLVNMQIKSQIAHRALQIVSSGEVLAIDAGTTAYQVAKALPPDFYATVITHSLPVMSYLVDRPQITTIGLCGTLFTPSRAFVGSRSLQALEDLRATTFFMGAAAVSADGIFASWDIEKDIKLALGHHCARIVLLVDHTKFEAVAPVFLMGWNNRITVVTDWISPKLSMALRSQGVQIIT